MRFPKTSSSILLLLVPSITSALNPAKYDSIDANTLATSHDHATTDDLHSSADTQKLSASSRINDPVDAVTGKTTAAELSSDLKTTSNIPTRDAPRDGKDGKPHLGPFVGTDSSGLSDSKTSKAAPLKGRPQDPTIVDGVKIPETNDGIMFDKNRERPVEGTTGTEGGVSEKAKQRKVQESVLGGNVVEAPKEKPHMPNAVTGTVEKTAPSVEGARIGDQSEDTTFTGLDKPDDLPERTHDKNPPLPESVNKDHLGISHSKTSSSANQAFPEEDEEGIIQPFHSFILSFTMILVSEVGDKTFLVAALMAMKHDRMLVFSAAFGALLVMTVLSAVLGHAVPTLIPKQITSFLAAGLFFVFGARLLKEGMQMDPNEGVSAEMYEVEAELAEKEKGAGRDDYALEMGLKGDRGRANGRYSPHRSPSQSPQRRNTGAGWKEMLSGSSNLFSLLLSPAWVQTFVMTFLGEWGDRSQIATIAMAAGQDYWWVTLGAMCGHCICTGVAVIGGKAIAGRVSLKMVTIGGAVAFLLFGFIYFFEAFYA